MAKKNFKCGKAKRQCIGKERKEERKEEKKSEHAIMTSPSPAH